MNDINKGPYIVDENDSWLLGYIHGRTDKQESYTVQLSDIDITYLVEHLFLYLQELMDGKPLLGAFWDTDGKEQMLIWRLVNLMIQSGGISRDKADDIFYPIIFESNDGQVPDLFDRYIV